MADTEDDTTEEQPVATADASTVNLSAPTAPPAATPGPALDDMVVSPEQQKALQDRLVALKRGQIAQTDAGAGETIARLRRDRAQMEEAFKATALPPDALQPWDTKAKQNEYRTDPVEAFGSLGSVFAMLAPAFIGLPMDAALNAGAAAINAIHQQDEKAYDRDYKAWKDNTDLALKRHEIMRQAYNDSILKMNTNLNAGRSEMELNARKFGDQQALAFLEAGLDPELNKLIDARNKTALEFKRTADEVWLQHEKVQDLRNDPNYLSGNDALRAKAIQDWQERWRAGGRSQLAYDAEKDYMDARKREKPDWTPADLLTWKQEFTQAENAGAGPSGSPRAQEIERRTQEYMKPTEEGGLGLDRTAAYDKASKEVANVGKADSGKLTRPQMEEAERKKYEAAVRAEHPDWDETRVLEESRRRQRVGNPPAMTAAQAGKYQDRTFLADYTLGKLDTQIERLQRRSGLTGLGGVITRGKERIGNIFGSNEVEAQEFYKDLEEMRLNAGRMLTLSQGRPLASEAARINAVLKGNSIGDLTAPTLAAMRDYQEFVRKFKEDSNRRLQGEPTPSQTGGAPSGGHDGSGPKKKPWERDPIIGPRSDLSSTETFV